MYVMKFQLGITKANRCLVQSHSRPAFTIPVLTASDRLSVAVLRKQYDDAENIQVHYETFCLTFEQVFYIHGQRKVKNSTNVLSMRTWFPCVSLYVLK
jgi:hypothetical protein